jgi:hypothetical protein
MLQVSRVAVTDRSCCTTVPVSANPVSLISILIQCICLAHTLQDVDQALAAELTACSSSSFLSVTESDWPVAVTDVTPVSVTATVTAVRTAAQLFAQLNAEIEALRSAANSWRKAHHTLQQQQQQHDAAEIAASHEYKGVLAAATAAQHSLQAAWLSSEYAVRSTTANSTRSSSSSSSSTASCSDSNCDSSGADYCSSESCSDTDTDADASSRGTATAAAAASAARASAREQHAAAALAAQCAVVSALTAAAARHSASVATSTSTISLAAMMMTVGPLSPTARDHSALRTLRQQDAVAAAAAISVQQVTLLSQLGGSFVRTQSAVKLTKRTSSISTSTSGAGRSKTTNSSSTSSGAALLSRIAAPLRSLTAMGARVVVATTGSLPPVDPKVSNACILHTVRKLTLMQSLSRMVFFN